MPVDLAAAVNDPNTVDLAIAKVVSPEGKPLGMPWWKGSAMLFYNLDHFKEAGLGRPAQNHQGDVGLQRETGEAGAEDGTLIRAGNSLRLTEPVGGIQKVGYLYYQMTGMQSSSPARNSAPYG